MEDKKMITATLSIEDYNRLYLYYFQGKDEYEKIYVKIKDNQIIFVCDYDSDVAIASVSLDTPEGKILSNYTECLLRIMINDEGEIFIYESCMNPHDQYIGHCYNCFVNYSESSYSCRKGVRDNIKKMDNTIDDVRFVDPIPNRNRKFVEELERWGSIIEGLNKDCSHIADDDVKKICETAQLLQCQIETLYDKWSYGNYDRFDY